MNKCFHKTRLCYKRKLWLNPNLKIEWLTQRKIDIFNLNKNCSSIICLLKIFRKRRQHLLNTSIFIVCFIAWCGFHLLSKYLSVSHQAWLKFQVPIQKNERYRESETVATKLIRQTIQLTLITKLPKNVAQGTNYSKHTFHFHFFRFFLFICLLLHLFFLFLLLSLQSTGISRDWYPLSLNADCLKKAICWCLYIIAIAYCYLYKSEKKGFHLPKYFSFCSQTNIVTVKFQSLVLTNCQKNFWIFITWQ